MREGGPVASTTAKSQFQPALRWRLCVASVVAIACFALDRATKLAVQMSLDPVPFVGSRFEMPLIPGFLGLSYVENTGAAFSMGEGFGGAFVLLALVVTVGAFAYLLRAEVVSKLEVVGLALVVGGAIGNAVDRAVFGYVVDFIATEFIDFPVFNVADIGITCGVVIAFIGFLVSPANRVDATAELNRRDEADRARRVKARGDRARAWRERNGR